MFFLELSNKNVNLSISLSSRVLVLTRFTQQLLYRLPQIHGDFKTKCLEMLLSRASTIDDLFVELKSKNFTTLLQHR